jgi:hypothetical protein
MGVQLLCSLPGLCHRAQQLDLIKGVHLLGRVLCRQQAGPQEGLAWLPLPRLHPGEDALA